MKNKNNKNSLKLKKKDFSLDSNKNSSKLKQNNNKNLFKNSSSSNIKTTPKNTTKSIQKKAIKEQLKNRVNNTANFKFNTNNKNNFNLENSIRNKDNFNLNNNIKIDNNFNLKENIDTSNNFNFKNNNEINSSKNIDSKVNFKDILKKDNLKNIVNEKTINLSTKEKLNNLENPKIPFSNSQEEKEPTKNKSSRLHFNNDEKDYSLNHLNTDIKNLHIEAKKNGLIFEKTLLERKIKKKYQLQFKEKKEVINENGNLEIKTKFNIIPQIKQAGFRYNDTVVRKGIYRLNDLARGKIHNKIYETEDDNTTVKTVHTIERNIERNLISFNRNSNYRKIKKHTSLEKKISKLENKQVLNNLKVEYKDSKDLYKKAVKNQIKKNRYKKMMIKKMQKANRLKKSSKFVSNVLSFAKGGNVLAYLLSFKAILIAIVLFIIMVFLSLVITVFSSFTSGVGNIYEIQKAELYYRELEAEAEFYNNKYIDHDPIDLSSFLTTLFGDFVFDEEMEIFLKEQIFSKQEQGKSLKQIISDSLTTEQYTYYLELYQTKGGHIKYGSPFAFEYEPYITSYIGYRINPTSSQAELQLHKGLDIGVAGGTPILAISDGIVTRADFSSSYGNIVEILHNDGYVSKYAHQQKLNVVKGQQVKQGDIIGFVGTTGDSTGNHLHLELYDEVGEFMNPIYFIERSGQNSTEQN